MQCSAVQCSAVQCSAVQCSAVHCTAMQCNAMQCNAMQCNAMQCNAMQCNAMQCNAMQCNAMQCNAMQCNAMQCNAMQCNAMQCNAMQCNAMQCNAMQCNAMQCNAMQCNAMQCNAMQCNAMQCNAMQWCLLGEDRWLCTLLLQQGYRVDYTAASDALTYAPEGFNEFFNQRRRWTLSTLTNVMDLLSTAGNTVRMNDNISWFYMWYQGGLMAATILGPATVILAIATAFETVLQITKWESYVMSLLPVVFQLIISFTTKKNTQLLVCGFLSTFYSCVMTVVLVGIIKGFVGSSLFKDPSLVLLIIMTASFIIAGIMHPYEFTCLPYGIIYYLCIPSGYLVLIIFAMSNMQDISWGTRDVPKKKTKAQLEEEKKREEEKKQKKKRGWFSFLKFDSLLKEVRDMVNSVFAEKKDDSTQIQILKTLRHIRKDLKKKDQRNAGDNVSSDSESEVDKKPEDTTASVERLEQSNEPAAPEPEEEDFHRELY